MKQLLNKLICSAFGHKATSVYEERLRRNNGNMWSRKGGKKRVEHRYVLGSYEKCERCGTKLSNFRRLYRWF